MHFSKYKLFSFVKNFKEVENLNFNYNLNVIYRNYSRKTNLKTVLKIKKYCIKKKSKLYISNNIKLALKIGCTGVYIPSFNKNLNILVNKKNFEIIGSAHNIIELKIKEKQGVQLVLLSPIFKTKKNRNFLKVSRFNLIANTYKNKIIALGGIKIDNLNKLKMLNIVGFAGINFFKKKYE